MATMNAPRRLIRAAMIVDGDKAQSRPGALLFEGQRLLAAGSPRELGEPSREAVVVDLPRSVLIPGLVNAHAHLDLTHIGPLPYTGDFISWVDQVRRRRAVSEEKVVQSVLEGAELAWAGGTALVGDIAGVRSLAPIEALRQAGLPGVSYLEVFGVGKRQAEAIAVMRQRAAECPADDRGVRLGLQPHAPYSCGLEVYAAAVELGAELGLPLATHLAETVEELQFVRDGGGPLAAMLQRLCVWDESIVGSGMHALEHLGEHLACAPFAAAHLNYVEPRHVELMSRWPISVVYCPRASAYFGHHRDGGAPHRYREMIAAGVNVALGTDSILCLDTPQRIGVLDEMRFLHRRDATDTRLLLRMATINGAFALGADSLPFTFQPGLKHGVLAIDGVDPDSSIDPLVQALAKDEPPRWVIGPPRAGGSA